MQLSQMWREHLQAGCPPEMRGLNIAGTAARELDAEITACVSACVTHSLKMDSRIERRLHDIAHALEDMSGAGVTRSGRLLLAPQQAGERGAGQCRARADVTAAAAERSQRYRARRRATRRAPPMRRMGAAPIS